MNTPVVADAVVPLKPAPGLPKLLRAPALDPESDSVLGVLNPVMRPPDGEVSLRRQRRMLRYLSVLLGRTPDMLRVSDHRIPGPAGEIEIRVYRPSPPGVDLPAFLWFHGGAFLLGGLETADSICRNIAQASGTAVVAARYRLCPEHTLYDGRADAYATLEWLHAHGRELGIDPTRLAVGGDSAGGNLAAVVAQQSRLRGGPPLRLQVLVYPASNLRDEYPSLAENAKGYLLTAEAIDWIQDVIPSKDYDLGDPLLSPLFQKDLSGLPPALVLTAGFDPIRDDGLTYVSALRAAGVPVDLLHYAGQFHGFLNFDGVLRAARDALQRIGREIGRALFADAEGAETPHDRTIEIAATTREGRAPDLDAASRLMIAGLMFGERLEHMRAGLLRALVPPLLLSPRLVESPLLHPAGQLRAQLADRYARLVARETFTAAPTHSGGRHP